MKVQLGQILEVVKSTVPQELWGEIVEKIEELEQHPEALDVGTDAFDDADDALRPDRVHRRGRRLLTSARPAVSPFLAIRSSSVQQLTASRHR